MKVRYAYETKGRIVRTGVTLTDYTDPQALAEALAEIPPDIPIEWVLIWCDPNAPVGTRPDARVRQRAAGDDD
jgi:hypothetical protein